MSSHQPLAKLASFGPQCRIEEVIEAKEILKIIFMPTDSSYVLFCKTSYRKCLMLRFFQLQCIHTSELCMGLEIGLENEKGKKEKNQ